jgi:predicted nucleic acid-binding protein
MYLVDTSVWIHGFRPSGSLAIRSLLRALILADGAAITDWVVLELMTGLSRSEQKEALIQRLAPIRNLPFDPSWWEKSWDHAATLRKRGVSTTAADCLIATVALEHHVALIHCDADFEIMKPMLSLETLDWSGHLRR